MQCLKIPCSAHGVKVPRNEIWQQQVGERLLQSMVALGKKPAEIARFLNISQQRLSNYTRGTRPLDIDMAMKLATRFGITLDWLYMGDLRSLPYELAQRIALIQGEERPRSH